MPTRTKQCRTCPLLLCVGLLAIGLRPWPPPAGAADAPNRQREQARISALLDAVERSGAKFIREGKTYAGIEGRKHLERKLRYAGDRVRTAEEFIEGIASRSSTTGRPYSIKLPSGELMETGPWLRQRLAEIDARR